MIEIRVYNVPLSFKLRFIILHTYISTDENSNLIILTFVLTFSKKEKIYVCLDVYNNRTKFFSNLVTYLHQPYLHCACITIIKLLRKILFLSNN